MMKCGYYHLWLAPKDDQTFFASNLDKAFFVLLLQDCLSPRTHLPDLPTASSSLPIDLVAYSLTDFGLNLLVYASTTKAVRDFGQTLLIRYADYLQQQRAWGILPFDTIFAYDRLRDAHEALDLSREIHLLHDEWRDDRYSSIGFYLDDRRGDWIQPWRLTQLFQNDTDWYLRFLHEKSEVQETDASVRLEFIET